MSLFGPTPDRRRMQHLEASRKCALEEEYERVLAHCARSGLVPNAAPKEIGVEAEGERIRPLGTRMYPAMIEGNEVDQELWITLLAANDIVLRVWLMTPAKEADFEHWATSRRAYEIVLGTLR
jgi:hypothetical protein